MPSWREPASILNWLFLYKFLINDSEILRKHGIDSVVVTALPLKDGKLDMSYLYHCHSVKDSLQSISVDDMRIFSENIVYKLIN